MPQDFTEKTLEDIIIENKDKISERGFPAFYQNVVRQFKLPSGKIIDILSFMIVEDILMVKIFELKRDEIKIDGLCQISDYAYEFFCFTFPHFSNVQIDKFIVGSDASKEVISINDLQIGIELYLYKYTINGLFFKKFESIMNTEHPKMFELLSQETPHSIGFADRLRIINNQNLPAKQN